MIEKIENFSLKGYNSFGLDVKASVFFHYTQTDELIEYIREGNLKNTPFLIMGGGSNLLFVSDFHGVVMHSGISGIEIVDETGDDVIIAAGAGVDWDNLVAWTVENNIYGLENLSLIPGRVGAVPVQNIGAYGVEAKDCIYKVKGIHLKTGERLEYNNEQCRFGYRDSIFKNELKNQVVITSVVFKLDKFPEFKLEYGALKTEVEKLGTINLNNIRQAVINIRESKLPDPKILGNGGSFFKNPVVDAKVAQQIIDSHEQVPHYNAPEEGKIKLAAGWLIEQCGWKGFRNGNVGVHQQQALVLVHYGSGSGNELVALANEIKQSVFEKFGVMLEPEVNIVE